MNLSQPPEHGYEDPPGSPLLPAAAISSERRSQRIPIRQELRGLPANRLVRVRQGEEATLAAFD